MKTVMTNKLRDVNGRKMGIEWIRRIENDLILIRCEDWSFHAIFYKLAVIGTICNEIFRRKFETGMK